MSQNPPSVRPRRAAQLLRSSVRPRHAAGAPPVEPSPPVLSEQTASPRASGQSFEPLAVGHADAPGELVENMRGSVRPRVVNPPVNTARPRRSEQLRGELETLRATPATDRNGRLKSAFLAAFGGMSQNAQAAVASGRPVDEYGLAAVLGGGLGGAVAGGTNPRLDEERKREATMSKLKQHLNETLSYEKLEQERLEREAKMRNDGEETRLRGIQIEQQGARDRSMATYRTEALDRRRPADYTIGGVRMTSDWDDEQGKWVARPASTADGQGVVDRAKQPDADGLLPMDGERINEWRANRQSRESEGMLNRQSRAGVAAARGASRTGGARGNSDRDGARRTRAAQAINQLSELQRKAEIASTARQREAFQRQMKTKGDLIRSQFGDLVEDDAQGWPMRMKAPQSAPAAGGGQTTEADIRAAGQRRRMSEGQIGEAVRRAKERGLLR